ncbi:polyprenyl synthetase family protein [Lysinibacillus pakistanensis]|uniref:polyprenyl synthetase family protein n=1 Tax=Lysinibacillus pakistanensis TaxID=759811 RepID=UPI003D2CC9AB
MLNFNNIQDGDVLIYPWSNVNLGKNFINVFLLTALHKVTLLNDSVEARNFISQQIQLLLLQSINGQQKDMHNRISNESEYLEMVSLKSGSLIKLACILGAVDIPPKTLETIKTYANYLGVVAQIRNDVHDLLADHTINDLHIKKVNLPILYHLCIEDNNFQSIKNYYHSNGYCT